MTSKNKEENWTETRVEGEIVERAILQIVGWYLNENWKISQEKEREEGKSKEELDRVLVNRALKTCTLLCFQLFYSMK